MPQESGRQQRIADYLRREVALLIQHEMRDPRVGMVNVNDVSVTKDLSLAKIYVTFVGDIDSSARDAAVQVLNKASGFLRSQIAASNHMRTTPRLLFVFDESVHRGADLSRLIDQAVQADSRVRDGSQAGEL